MSGCSGWNSVNPLCRAGQILGSGAKAAGKDIFSAIAHYFASVANSMVTWLWRQLSTATSIDLTNTSIKSDLIATGAIAALVTFALFLIQVIASALRQDPGGLGRAVRGLCVAFVGAAFAVATTQLLLAAVDGLCNSVVQFALGTDMSGMGSKLITTATLTSIANPAGLLLLSLVLISAVVVVWVALMIRKMLIIISAVFAPIAFSGAASDVSRSWVRRWIEFTLALVFSKLILVITFMIGLSVLNGASQSAGNGNHATQSMTNLAVGSLTLLLAGFAPWIAIKMVHFAGESFHAVHAQASTAGAGAQTVVAAPQKAASAIQRHQSLASTAGGGSSTPPANGGGGGGGGQAKSGGPAGGSSGGAVSVSSGAPALAGVAMVAASAVRGAAVRQATSGADTAGRASEPRPPTGRATAPAPN